MSRGKKKHVCSCGEEFNHGIGLRKHQRQTGHKGSSIVDDEGGGGGDEGGEEEAAPAPAAAPAPPAPPPKAEPAPPPPPPAKPADPPPKPAEPPKAAATPAPAARAAPPPAAADEDDEADEPADQTVPVSRGTGRAAVAVEEESWSDYETQSRFQHNKQKMQVVSSGLKVIAKSRAREAGHQLKQSARSGADIFAEAFKIAIALLLLMAIPCGVFWWWYKHHKAPPPPVNVPNTFTFEEGALSARSELLKYLDSLAKSRWDDAYGRLSGGWQGELSAPSFREAFSSISDIRWAIDDQKLMPDGSAEVTLLLGFVEDGRAKKFPARFRLVREGEAWKVDRAELSAAPAP